MRNLLIFFVALLVACGETPNESTSSEETPFSLGMEELALIHEGCDSSECTTVEWGLPVLEGGDAAVSERVNSAIRSIYLNSSVANVSEGSNPADLESFAQLFFDGYAKMEKDFPDSPAWYFEIDGSESKLLGDSVLALNFQTRSFMGGAHGNSLTELITIDLSDGKKMDLKAAYGEAVKEIAEIKFRSSHGVSPDAELNEQGFIFPEEGFVLPENIGYYEDGFVLHYNSYEVAPYAVGPTELKISFSEIAQREEV